MQMEHSLAVSGSAASIAGLDQLNDAARVRALA
jgi:hypothetical protein